MTTFLSSNLETDTSQPNATDVSLPIGSSANSLVAKNGLRAEVAFCSQKNIKQSLELYFNSPIKCLKRIHGKKYDIKIEFENGTETTIQNKDGTPGANPPFWQMGAALAVMILLFELIKLLKRSKTRSTT